MFGEKAYDLVKELKRSSKNGTIPPYNEELITHILEEMRVLFDVNQKEVTATVAGEEGLFAGVQLRHSSLEHNKRCLMAYIQNRMFMLRNLRWELGSVLPQDVKVNLSDHEMKWFAGYNKMLGKYMESIGDRGLDLTQNIKPPKSLCIEVRCLVDYGELETEDGTVILLKKNSQHYLPRTQCEHLIRQGILQHIH